MTRTVRTIPGRGIGSLVATSSLLACLGVGCPPPPPSGNRTAPPRPAVSPAVRVLHRMHLPRGFVQLLGMDWQRGEAYLFRRAFGPAAARPPVHLLTIPWDGSGKVRRWALPRDARSLVTDGLLYEPARAQGAPWFMRLVQLVKRLGPWYRWRLPPVLTLSPQGDRIVYSETADKKGLLGVRSGRPQPLNGNSPACYRFSFSPDGRWLAYSCFSRRYKTYCPTLRAVNSRLPAPPPRPRQRCDPRGSGRSASYWQPDSRAFYTLVRRGRGAYIDSVHRVCLVRVEVPSGRSRAVWCRSLDPKRDRRRYFLFRPSPDGRTGVVVSTLIQRNRCRSSVRWFRLADGKRLAAWTGLPASVMRPPFAVLGTQGRLLLRSCLGDLLSVELASGRAAKVLPHRYVEDIEWDGEHRLLFLEQQRGRHFRLLRVDLRRAPAAPLPRLKPLAGSTGRR